MRVIRAMLAAPIWLGATFALAQTGQPMDQVIDTDIADCRPGSTVEMPLIAWGADAVTIHANGNSMQTTSGRFDDADWSLNLSVVDAFDEQLGDYLSCRSPFLRGTLGMLVAAAPVTEADARTEQVVIYKHSWSAGDGLVAGAGIEKVSDLSGKRVAIQAYGPHVDFVGRVLEDAGLSIGDIEIVWTDGLTGEGASTPSQMLLDGKADAAAVILPDARVLTSGGAVGTGAEGSLQGAQILFSTQEATAVIGDYISVRRDYFDTNREAVKALVAALFQSEEEVRRFMAEDGSAAQQELAEIMADELLGGLPPEEGVFLWQDAITDGWSGNAAHFIDAKEPRRFGVMLTEVSRALQGAGMVQRPYDLAIAGWDYPSMTEGLADISAREIAKFDPEAAAAVVQRLRRTGQLDANTKLDFKVYFEPDATSFPVEFYADDFEELLRLAATYSGAIITVEGHADPLHYLRREKDGAPAQELRAIRTSAKNLSYNRAIAVLDALDGYAEAEGIPVNREQFTLDGIGIETPEFSPPKTQEEWRLNMRVVFRILTTQAEATTFAPL